MKNKPNAAFDFAQFGRAALLPGLQYAIDVLQQTANQIRSELANGSVEPRKVLRSTTKRDERLIDGDVRTRVLPGQKAKMGWSDDPEERQADMARRMEARKKKKQAKVRSEAAKKRWASLSKAAQVKHIEAMNKARLKTTPVKLEKAS